MTKADCLHDGRLFQPLGYICSLERPDQFGEVPLHHAVQIIKRQADAMIGYAVLWKIVGANLFFTAAGTDLATALRAIFF